MKEQHFKYIFWYIIGTTGFSLIYVLAVTFLHIPKENIRFADTAQGFLLGQLVSAGAGFLVVRSAQKSESTTAVTQNADSITNTPAVEEK